MRILKIIILLSCLGISYTVAQRRHQNAAETQPETAANPVAAIRGRGRARFVKTPEFEQVSSDYAAASRSTTNEGRSEDRSALYHRPRVITEDKFELPNAPKSKLFDSDLTAAQMTPEPIPVDQLIKNFGSLKSDEPTKVELPQILLQQDESEGASSSSTTSQELSDVSSSTTEKEMAMELLKKEVSTKKIENSDVSSTTTSHIPRRTVVRGRSKQKPTEASSDTSSPSPPVRTRGRSRPVASITESSPTASRRASSVEETSTRGSFRVGRRRPTQNLRDRGPVPTEEDSLSPKTRTGRDSNANPPSRRGSVRNFTPRSQPEVTENTPRPNRADVRRSRGRKLDSPLPTENTDSSNKPTEFASRRTRTRPPVNNQPIQEPTPLQSRTSPRIATETPAPTRALPEVRSRSQSPQNNDPTIVSTPQRNSRGRARSRFQLDIENTKLEPQPSIEHSTRAVPRRAGRTRAPAAQPEELIASSTVENPIRVTLPPTSTIRSVNSIPTRVKESVHSEVSEVISRKVMRRKKPAPTKVAGKKSLEVDDDIDELNYPPQFKAIILANKSKDEKEKKVEDVDNDLAPKSTLRPTRRRFSASTRKPHAESKVVSTRKPAKTLPTRKLVANPDSEKLAKFHAHFNTQFQQRNHDDSSTHAPPGSTTKRTTKQPSKFTHPRKTDTKTVERRFNQQPTKSNRYSSRYRGEAARPSIPTRAATTSPIYIPTVPTVTPSALGVAPASQSTHQAPEKIDAETDDIKIISIAEPKANSLYSDNLVTEINTVVTATEQPAGSILERIINSISSISTTTSKPDAKVTSTETAIFRIPPPSPKVKVEAGRVDKQLTTEKPTTIIERILNSLSAIQASDNNVGDKAGNELDAKLDQVSSLVTETSSPPAPVPSTTTPTTTTTTRSTTITTTTVPPTTTVIRLSSPAITSTVRVAPAPTNKPSQSTVAISLADFLASLGNAKPTSPTTTPASTTSIIDENKNTIDYLGISTTTEPATTTTVQPTTNVPTTAKVVPTTTTRRPTTTLPITTTVIPTTNSWILKFLGLETTTFMSTTTFIQDTTVVPRVDTTTFKTTVAPKTTTMMDSTTESTSTETISTSTTTTGNTNTLTANALNLEITTPIINEVSEVNLLSLDLNNDTETLLTGKTLEEYTSIFDQTITTAPSTSTESTISTTPVSVTTTTNNPTTTNTNPTSQEISNSETTHLTTTIPTTTSPTVESTPQTITEESDIISTEMSIDMTTLNIPMIIELGPETSTLREEIGTTLIDNVTEVNPVTSSTSKVNIETTTLDLPETTTNLAEVIFESKNSFENEDFKTIEDFEDTTLPMPDTSTIVMTSTSTPDTTIAPTITPKSSTAPISTDWTIIPSSHRRFRLRLIRRRRPIRRDFLEIIHTTTLPATGDDLENEIRNAADLSTSRIVEVSTTPVAATTTSVPTTSRTTTRTTTTEMPTTTTRMTTTQPTTTTRRPTTTTQRPTTTRPRTTTTRPTTTTTFPTTTTYLPPTTTDLTTFIANILSTLRPVYTPTTVVSTFPTLAETTTIPTVTITARRRTIPTTSPTEHSTTVRAANVRRRTMPYTTTEPTIITRTVPTTPATTTFKFDSTTLDPTKVDIDEIVRKSKKKLTPEQLREIEQLKVLEREQANLLKQLSLLTANLNLNGQPKNSASNTASSNLANRIVNFAKERDPTTTEFHIYTEIPTTRIPKKLPALDSKGTTVEDILKELNALQNGIGDSNGGGRSQEAIIAEILKQRGIVPSTPKSLRAAFTTTPATTKRPRTTTTQRPGRIMQGLSWLLNQFAGGPPPAPAPAPAPRPRPTTRRTTTTTTTTTNRPDYDELHFQSTEVNNVIRNTPATTSTFKRPVNSLSDDELSRLIKQLEAIQRDPKLAQNLDISPFRKLQAQQTTLNNKNVEIFTTGGGSNQVTRNPKAVESSRVRTAKSTTSNSIEDLDEDNEVTTARVRATQAPRSRVTLPPVELNHVPGIEDNSQGPPIGGNFLNAAVNVTRALSTFLGAAIQVAARQVASMIANGSRGLAALSPSDSDSAT